MEKRERRKGNEANELRQVDVHSELVDAHIEPTGSRTPAGDRSSGIGVGVGVVRVGFGSDERLGAEHVGECRRDAVLEMLRSPVRVVQSLARGDCNQLQDTHASMCTRISTHLLVTKVGVHQ